MATPTILINQTGKAAGTSGQSRSDLAIGSLVTVTDPANGAGTYAWIFVRPPDSSAVASGLATDTVTFTPDVPGNYLLFLTYNGVDKSFVEHSYGEDTIRISAQGGAGVKTAAGDLIPGVGETTQFGTSGWALGLSGIIKRRIQLKQEGGLVSSEHQPFTTLDFRAIGGGSVTVVDNGGGEAIVTLSGGAGGGGSLTIQDEGLDLAGGPHTKLNFLGAGVEATNAGSGVANVTVSATSSGSAYERHSSFGVPVLTSGIQEASLGSALFSGSVVGFTARLLEARTAGDVTVSVKVDGTQVQAGVLDGSNTTSISVSSPIGTHVVAAGEEITIKVAASSTFTTAVGETVGLIVNVMLYESSPLSGSANVAFIDVPQVYTKGQSVQQLTLTAAANVGVDGSSSNNFELVLTQATQELDNPTGVSPGTTLNFAVRQDGTGSRLLTYGSAYKFPTGLPATTSGSGEEHLMSCYVRTSASGVAATMLCSRTEIMI